MKSTLLGITWTALLIGVPPGVVLAEKPLTSVQHDATLTGAGTASSPLSVVPVAAGGGLKLLDSNDQFVGSLIDASIVIRVVSGHALALQVDPSGFLPTSQVYLYFESKDCSGTGYYPVDAGFFSSEIGSSGSTRYFVPVTKGAIRPIQSYGWPGDYCAGSAYFAAVDVPFSVDFAALGLVPPFHVSQ